MVIMKKSIWIGLVLIAVVLVSAMFFLGSYLMKPPVEDGFRIVSLENNALLVSDADIVSYNWTSQELSITDAASQRLLGLGDSLYSFSGGFIMRINGEEIVRGVFRAAYMSAIPAPPKISILFPSLLYPSDIENPKAMMLFYPSGKPPIDQPETNAKLSSYFEKANKLTY